MFKIALQYRRSGLALADLVAEGNMGLLQAIDRFDETRGIKFISYAVWWIRQSILAALARMRRATPDPAHGLQGRWTLTKAADLISHELGRLPTAAELGERLGISVERAARALVAPRPVVSLDAPVAEGNDKSHLSLLAAENEDATESVARMELSDLLQSTVDTLDEREATTLQKYFGLGNEEPRTLEEIGQFLGVTQERTRQIRDLALQKLRARHVKLLRELALP